MELDPFLALTIVSLGSSSSLPCGCLLWASDLLRPKAAPQMGSRKGWVLFVEVALLDAADQQRREQPADDSGKQYLSHSSPTAIASARTSTAAPP